MRRILFICPIWVGGFQVGDDTHRVWQGFATEYASGTCRLDAIDARLFAPRAARGERGRGLRFAATNLAMSHRVTSCGCTQEVNEFVDSSRRWSLPTKGRSSRNRSAFVPSMFVPLFQIFHTIDRTFSDILEFPTRSKELWQSSVNG